MNTETVMPKYSLSLSEMEVRKQYHLTLSKIFIQKYGINFALLLSEIDRLTHSKDEHLDSQGFLLITYELFERDIRLSKGQVKPIADKMEELEILETKYTHEGRRKLYRLNRDKVIALLRKLVREYEARKKSKLQGE